MVMRQRLSKRGAVADPYVQRPVPTAWMPGLLRQAHGFTPSATGATRDVPSYNGALEF